jgi:hypothetical protein
MLSVANNPTMLSVIMLSVVMLNVIMLSVVVPNLGDSCRVFIKQLMSFLRSFLCQGPIKLFMTLNYNFLN